MNYQRIYNELINSRLLHPATGYVERHHILPKSLGGSDSLQNIVVLTAREHFIAHLLLSKIYVEGTINWIKMQKALMRMMSMRPYQQRYSPSKWYAYCRKKASIANSMNQSGKNNSQFGKAWVYNETIKISKSIKKELLSTYLEKGWCNGRVLKWEGTCKNRKTPYLSPEEYIEKEVKKEKRKNIEQQNVQKYTEYYLIYDTFGWKEFVKRTGYNKTKQNLVKQFRKYVKEFVPQNGKKRGKY